MSLTLKKITNAIKAPIRKVWREDLRTLVVDNPAALALWIYGSRMLGGVTPAHDHADAGAELVRGTLLSVSYGPYQREGTGGASYVRGIPLTRNPLTPKLMAPNLVTLPGGVTRLRGALMVSAGAGAGAPTLTVVLRSVGRANEKINDASASVIATADLTWSVLAGYSVLEWSWTKQDLHLAKPLQTSARCEFCVYQKTANFSAGGGVLIGAELWSDDDSGSSQVRHPAPQDPPASEVTFSEILAGKILLTQMSRKFKSRWNSLMHGVLGRAPGLSTDAVALDRTRKWRWRVKGAHRHTGLLVPDSSGGYYSDGAVLRYPPKWSASFARQWGEDNSALKNADASQARGEKFHSSGALDATWLQWDSSIDLESGLGALDVSCEVEPGSVDSNAVLQLHVGVYREGDAGGTNLVKAVSCDMHRDAGVDAGGLLICELEPEENESWIANANRRNAGLGVYTLRAKKSAALANAQFESVNAYRVSKIAKVEISHPGYQVDGVARPTGRYVLRVRLSLATSATYDAAARVLSFEATASKGY